MGWQEDAVSEIDAEKKILEKNAQKIIDLWEKIVSANETLLPEVRLEHRLNGKCLGGRRGYLALRDNYYISISNCYGDNGPPCIYYLDKTNSYYARLGMWSDGAFYYFDESQIEIILRCCVTGENPLSFFRFMKGGFKEACGTYDPEQPKGNFWKKLFG